MRILAFVPLALAIAGALIAQVLIDEHLTVFGGGVAGGLLCGRTGAFDCTRVAAHSSSWIFGVPWALIGQIFYFLVAGVALAALVQRESQRRLLWRIGLLAAALAVVVDAWLLYVMLYRIGHVCLNCVATYVVNLGLLASFWALARATPRSDPGAAAPPRGRTRTLLAATAIAVAVALSAFSAMSLMRMIGEMRSLGEDELEEFIARMAKEPAIAASHFAPLPSQGPEAAPIQFVLVGDFQCGYCRTLAQEIETLRARDPQRIRVQFLNSPVDPQCDSLAHDVGHGDACWLAEASHCAGAQGKFWEYHHLLTETIPDAQVDKRGALARLGEIGIDAAQLETCLASGGPRQMVEAEIALARHLRITATPSLIVNGHIKNGGFYPWLLERLVARLSGTDAAGK